MNINYLIILVLEPSNYYYNKNIIEKLINKYLDTSNAMIKYHGKRYLCYKLANNNIAYYYSIKIKCNTIIIDLIRKHLSLNSKVLRYLILSIKTQSCYNNILNIFKDRYLSTYLIFNVLIKSSRSNGIKLKHQRYLTKLVKYSKLISILPYTHTQTTYISPYNIFQYIK